MDEAIIALAIDALERRKEAIQAEIDAIRGTRSAGPRPPKRSAAARKAQSDRMKAYGARKADAAKASQPAKATGVVRKPGPQSAAAKKAVSKRMKAYWAKRKAEQAGAAKKGNA